MIMTVYRRSHLRKYWFYPNYGDISEPSKLDRHITGSTTQVKDSLTGLYPEHRADVMYVTLKGDSVAVPLKGSTKVKVV